jgi:hypothetical protein
VAFILKTVESEGSPVASDNAHSLYADIVSVTFRREEGGAATAHCWLREPVKTANVPGFCEVEKYISFTGAAYVMNENGKTVSSFTARTSGDSYTTKPNSPDKGTGPDCAPADKATAPTTAALRDLPYNVAAAIRRAARFVGDKGLETILDYEGVAVDA